MTPHSLLHLLGAGLMVAGFVLLASARRALHSAQQRGVCYAYGRPAFAPRLSRVQSAIAELVRSVTKEEGDGARVAGASAPASHRRVS